MKYDSEYNYWYEYNKLPNGQSSIIVFTLHRDSYGKIEWHVGYAIADKKKYLRAWLCCGERNIIEYKETGTCGFDGLILAYRKLQELEKSYCSTGEIIVVEASDSRRFRVYEHFLKRIGYKKEKHPKHGWVMTKTL